MSIKFLFELLKVQNENLIENWRRRKKNFNYWLDICWFNKIVYSKIKNPFSDMKTRQWMANLTKVEKNLKSFWRQILKNEFCLFLSKENFKDEKSFSAAVNDSSSASSSEIPAIFQTGFPFSQPPVKRATIFPRIFVQREKLKVYDQKHKTFFVDAFRKFSLYSKRSEIKSLKSFFSSSVGKTK